MLIWDLVTRKRGSHTKVRLVYHFGLIYLFLGDHDPSEVALEEILKAEKYNLVIAETHNRE